MIKRRLLIPLVLLYCLLAIDVYAGIEPAIQNPDTRATLSLDGRWDIIIDPFEKGFYSERYEESDAGYFNTIKFSPTANPVDYDFSHAAKLNVPGDWNSQDDKLFLYEGTIWYHRDFDISKKTDQQYILYFGAVNYRATVYLNGKKLGTHEGGFAPFQFTLNDDLKNGINSLIVKVDNRRERDQIGTVNIDWWNYGGITRSVKIIQAPTGYIDDYNIQLSNAESDVIEGWVNVKNMEKLAEHTQVEIQIPELHIKQKVTLNKNGKGEFSFTAKPQHWSADTPKLYAVDLFYQQDVVHDQIGFRTLHVQGENILLNGKPIFLKGISIYEESPLHPGKAWSEEDARILLNWAKELGCNFIRLAHYPHNETIVRLADRMGLMLWSEIPVHRATLFNNPIVYDKAENQLVEMISRDKNRASIILWSIANDTPNTSARLKFIGELAQKARELDDTRLITAAVNIDADNKTTNVINDPLASIVDVLSVNQYCGWDTRTGSNCANLKWLSHYHKPMILSEFGAEALQGYRGEKNQRWTEDYQAEIFSNSLAMIDTISFLRGMSASTLKDFRSPNSQLPNIQDFWSRKGLISERGIKKKAWTVLYDYYNKKNAEPDKRDSAK